MRRAWKVVAWLWTAAYFVASATSDEVCTDGTDSAITTNDKDIVQVEVGAEKMRDGNADTLLQLVSEELEVTNNLILEYKKRAEALERLINQVVKNPNHNFDAASIERLRSQFSSQASNDFKNPRMTSVPDPPLSVETTSIFFDNFFSGKGGDITISESATKFAIFTIPVKSRNAKLAAQKAGYPDAISVLCQLLVDGSITFTDVHSNELFGSQQLVETTGEFGEVSFMKFSEAGQPYLYIANRKGAVLRFNMTVYLNQHRVVGMKRDSEMVSEVDPETMNAKPRVSVFLDVASQGFICSSPVAEDETQDQQADCVDLSMIELVTIRKSSTLVSYADGALRVFKADLSLWSETKVKEPVSAVTSNTNQLLYASGGKVFMVSPTALERPHKTCNLVPGAHVTSLAFDANLPYLFYIGGSGSIAGEVLVFNSKSRNHAGTVSCSMTGKLAVQTAASGILLTDSVERFPVYVSTLTGYLLAGVSNAIVVYNTTGTARRQPEFLFSSKTLDIHTQAINPSRDTLSTQRKSDEPRTTKYVVLSCCSKEGIQTCKVMDSMLPYEDVKTEMNWVRGPLMFGAIVFVFIWQYNKIRNKNASRPNPFNLPGQGFGGPFDPSKLGGMGQMDAEMQRILNEVRSRSSATSKRSSRVPSRMPFPSGFDGENEIDTLPAEPSTD